MSFLLRSSWLWAFASFFLFFNVLVKTVGIEGSFILASLFVFFILVSFLVSGDFKLEVNEVMLLFMVFLFFVLLVLFSYQKLVYDFNSIYYIGFYSKFLFIIILFSLLRGGASLVRKHYDRILLYFTFLIATSIFVDSLLIELGLDSYQLLYDATLSSYLDRPFGMFGQPSVNSSLLVACYLLVLYKRGFESFTIKMLFLYVTIAIVLQGSGSGFISYGVLLVAILSRTRWFAISFLLLCSVFFYIYINNLVHKISLKYILFLMEYLEMGIIEPYWNTVSSSWDFLFGVNGEAFVPIDFGPLFMIAKVGFVFFALYVSLIVFLIVKNRNPFHRAALISLLLASLHYPVLFYMATQFVLVLIIYDNFFLENKRILRNDGRYCYLLKNPLASGSSV